MAIEAMIFDFGNVLVGWEPDRLYRQLIPDAAERRRFLSEICDQKWNHQQDLGRSCAEAIAERVALFPESRALIEAYYGRFGEMLSGPVAEGCQILQRTLARGIPCYGLTNWSAETFELSRPMLPFLSDLLHIAVSGQLKLGKPEPEIFQHLLRIIGKPAGNCAFLDDVPANITTAQSLGIKAVLFKNDGSAVAALRAVGLPI